MFIQLKRNFQIHQHGVDHLENHHFVEDLILVTEFLFLHIPSFILEILKIELSIFMPIISKMKMSLRS